jgi:mono/diheme cytochrome c family protein
MELNMKKFFKWFGIGLGSLLVLIVIFFSILVAKGSALISQTFDISVDNVVIPTNTESIAIGEHWVKAECIGCHGDDLSGGVFLEAPFAVIDAKNLTPGQGGAGIEFTDQDWVRAIRHGVNPEGLSLMVMPAQSFWYYSDEDLGYIIAYLKTLPPVDKETREPSFNPLGKAMLAAGVLGNAITVAENISHDTRPEFPPAGVTSEYGMYLVNVSGCRECHGPDLSGGKSAEPTAKNAPNLTPGGELIAWQTADFIKTLRTGTTPFGHKLDPRQMPWEHFKNFSDNELTAIFLYMQSLPKLETTIP